MCSSEIYLSQISDCLEQVGKAPNTNGVPEEIAYRLKRKWLTTKANIQYLYVEANDIDDIYRQEQIARQAKGFLRDYIKSQTTVVDEFFANV